MGSTYSSPAALAAFASTGIISLAPNVIFLWMPDYAAGETSNAALWLTLGQAMAAGGLMGDVFLHTLAETGGGDSGIWVLLGFTVFLAADLVIRSLQGGTGGHSHAPAAASAAHHSHGGGGGSDSSSKNSSSRQSDGLKENGSVHPAKDAPAVNRSVIVLNLAADALHNFTDGLAIGATYSMAQHHPHEATTVWSMLTSHTRGGLATLSIFFHEVPHELGVLVAVAARCVLSCLFPACGFHSLESNKIADMKHLALVLGLSLF
jgi:solute carrier family 39 (zinc transporter), member 7